MTFVYIYFIVVKFCYLKLLQKVYICCECVTLLKIKYI